MPTLPNIIVSYALVTGLWTLIGLSITSFVMPRVLILPAAPAVGWAICSVVSVVLFRVVALDNATVKAFFILIGAAALAVLWFKRSIVREAGSAITLASLVSAGVLAAAILPAILPHLQDGAIALAAPIFDHSKVSLVNELSRSGLPAVNPMFGQANRPAPLPYYYLWHFSAAQIALSSGASGWEADVALTWFTAFSSLALMMGLASWFANSWATVVWVIVLATTASIRPLLESVFGYAGVYEWTGWPSGMGGWLFQLIWAPQHVQAAASACVALLLLSRLPEGGVLNATIAGLLAAASFQSSVWVGGITFGAACAVFGIWTTAAIEPPKRIRFLGLSLVAALLAIALSSPLILEQAASLAQRGAGVPLQIEPLEVLGDAISEPYRQVFNFPAFYLVYLPVELAAIYLVGMLMFVWLKYAGIVKDSRFRMIGSAIAAGVIVCGTIRSTVLENNDLSWRGALLAIIVLIPLAAAGLSLYFRKLGIPMRALAILLVAAGSYQGVKLISENASPEIKPEGQQFASAIRMWKAVDNLSRPDERVLNNPSLFGTMTPWPINISWALVSNRRSCYAHRDLVAVFVPLPRKLLSNIDALFSRVFMGTPEADDLRELATTYDCAIVVVASSDPAWGNDPLARSDLYRLVWSDGDWRIYRRHT